MSLRSFLRGLPGCGSVNADKITSWHEEFQLESCPDIDEVFLWTAQLYRRKVIHLAPTHYQVDFPPRPDTGDDSATASKLLADEGTKRLQEAVKTLVSNQ